MSFLYKTSWSDFDVQKVRIFVFEFFLGEFEKTDRTVNERTKEHASTDAESPMKSHLQTCCHFQHLYDIMSISENLFQDDVIFETEPSFPKFATNSIQSGVKILDTDSNWNQLLYKEALWIERSNPSLNSGLKASRQLKLFR